VLQSSLQSLVICSAKGTAPFFFPQPRVTRYMVTPHQPERSIEPIFEANCVGLSSAESRAKHTIQP
jgi:hypothetical protein